MEDSWTLNLYFPIDLFITDTKILGLIITYYSGDYELFNQFQTSEITV